MTRCIDAFTRYLEKSIPKGAMWVNPDLEVVVNCGQTLITGGKFKVKVNRRIEKQQAAMGPAWEKKFPYAFNRGLCKKVDLDTKKKCPPEDLTRDKSERGAGAYTYQYDDEVATQARGPGCCGGGGGGGGPKIP
jgi:hypothetical protein